MFDDFFGDLFQDVVFNDSVESVKFQDESKDLTPIGGITRLKIEGLKKLFPSESWIEVAKFFCSRFFDDNEDHLRAYADRNLDALADECLKHLIKLNLAYRGKDSVCLASRLDGNGKRLLEGQTNYNLSYRNNPIAIDFTPRNKVDPLVFKGIESRLCNPEKKLSWYRGSNARDPRKDECLNDAELWIQNDLQIKIVPSGYRNDAIIARLFYRFLPTLKWHDLGVLRISAKKTIVFSSHEIGAIDPSLRVRMYVLLKDYGLIPNEVVKDSNCSLKIPAILYSEALQERLNVSFERGSNPTIPYKIAIDDRAKMPKETTRSRVHTQIKRYASGEQLQRENDRLRKTVEKSEKRLRRANQDADRYQLQRDQLLTKVGTIEDANSFSQTRTEQRKLINLVKRDNDPVLFL